MAVEDQVVSLFAGTRGFLDSIPTSDVRRFEAELLDNFRGRHSDMLDGIKSSGAVADVDALTAAVRDFAERFAPTSTATET
jgi:F-type H+-transporting ATPase subunit alpha